MNDKELNAYITKQITKSIEDELCNNLFDSSSTTYTNIKNETLTIEKYQEMIYLIFPKLYYATVDYCEKGQVYICKETEYNPEYIIFYPDDFEQVKVITKGRTLVHIRDEPKEESVERLLKNLKIKSLNIGE